MRFLCFPFFKKIVLSVFLSFLPYLFLVLFTLVNTYLQEENIRYVILTLICEKIRHALQNGRLRAEAAGEFTCWACSQNRGLQHAVPMPAAFPAGLLQEFS